MVVSWLLLGLEVRMALKGTPWAKERRAKVLTVETEAADWPRKGTAVERRSFAG